jgi:hypothetical protein
MRERVSPQKNERKGRSPRKMREREEAPEK